MQELKGVGVAMVTPFNEDGSIDFSGLKKLVRHLHKGADFLVVMGTTGESVTLNDEEQMQILDAVAAENAGKLPLVFGIGGNNTAAVARKMKTFKHEAVVAFLSASPYYNKPTQEGIYQHYKAISAEAAKPVLIYNVPGRTASNILPATTLRIARDCPNIIGVKEAAGSIEQVMQLVKGAAPDFLVISGDDALFYPHMCCGGHGVISVLGNAWPQPMAEIIRLIDNNDLAGARAINHDFIEITAALFEEGNPAGIKQVLQLLGICEKYVRLPLVPASDALKLKLQRLMKALPEPVV